MTLTTNDVDHNGQVNQPPRRSTQAEPDESAPVSNFTGVHFVVYTLMALVACVGLCVLAFQIVR